MRLSDTNSTAPRPRTSSPRCSGANRSKWHVPADDFWRVPGSAVLARAMLCCYVAAVSVRFALECEREFCHLGNKPTLGRGREFCFGSGGVSSATLGISVPWGVGASSIPASGCCGAAARTLGGNGMLVTRAGCPCLDPCP